MEVDAISESFRRNLRTSAFGLVLAIATILFGQGMGIYLASTRRRSKVDCETRP